MAYTPTEWKNREVENPRTFQLQNNLDGTTTLIPKEGNVIEAGTPIIAETMNKIEQGIEEAHNGLSEIGDVTQELETHKADYIHHTGYANATGSANVYNATLTPALSAYQEGVSLRLKINVANTGAATVNINGLGAKAIKKQNGNAVVAGNLKAGLIYTLVYDGSSFLQQGEGGEYGNVTPNDVRLGKTFGTENGVANGSLDLSNLVPSNIKKDVTIDGKTGTLVPLPSVSPGPNNAVSITNSSSTSNTSYSVVKKMRINISGTYQIKTNLLTSTSGSSAHLELYVNSVKVGATRSNSSIHPAEYTDTVTLQANDEVHVAIRSENGSTYVYNTLLSLGIASQSPYATILQGN